MCTHLGCIIIGAIVIIIVLSLLFVIVEVWNKSQDRPDSHKIKAIVAILFSFIILVCILLRTYLDHKRRDFREAINVVLFFTCWALLVWVCMCGLFSKKEECTTEERILLRNLASSRTDLNSTRLTIPSAATDGLTSTSPLNAPSPQCASPVRNASPNHQRALDRATIITYENQIRILRKQLRRYQFMLDGEPSSSSTNSNTQFGDASAGSNNIFSDRSFSGMDTNTQSSQLSFFSDNWEYHKDEKQRSNSYSGACDGPFVFPTNRKIIHRSFPMKPWLSPRRVPRPIEDTNNYSSAVPNTDTNDTSSQLALVPSSETEVPETLPTISTTEESEWSPTSYDESMSSNILGTMESKFSN